MTFAGVSADHVSRLLSQVDDALTHYQKMLRRTNPRAVSNSRINHENAVKVLTELCVQMATLEDQIREGERGPEPFTLK